jgi:hypothetical protein
MWLVVSSSPDHFLGRKPEIDFHERPRAGSAQFAQPLIDLKSLIYLVGGTGIEPVAPAV